MNFGGQPLIGVVVPSDWVTEEDATSANPNRSLADIEGVIDEEPVVGSDMLELLRVASRDIYTPIGLALAHALPPGSTPRLARPWALTARGERALAEGALDERAMGGTARPILERLALKPLTMHALTKALPRVDLENRLRALAEDGLVERRVEVRRAKARIPMERMVRARIAAAARFADTTTKASTASSPFPSAASTLTAGSTATRAEASA